MCARTKREEEGQLTIFIAINIAQHRDHDVGSECIIAGEDSVYVMRMVGGLAHR